MHAHGTRSTPSEAAAALGAAARAHAWALGARERLPVVLIISDPAAAVLVGSGSARDGRRAATALTVAWACGVRRAAVRGRGGGGGVCHSRLAASWADRESGDGVDSADAWTAAAVEGHGVLHSHPATCWTRIKQTTAMRDCWQEGRPASEAAVVHTAAPVSPLATRTQTGRQVPPPTKDYMSHLHVLACNYRGGECARASASCRCFACRRMSPDLDHHACMHWVNMQCLGMIPASRMLWSSRGSIREARWRHADLYRLCRALLTSTAFNDTPCMGTNEENACNISGQWNSSIHGKLVWLAPCMWGVPLAFSFKPAGYLGDTL